MNRKAAPRFARIVVPLDGSALAEQALPYALAVGGDEAELLLVMVVPSIAGQKERLGFDAGSLPVVRPDGEREAQEELLRAATTLLGERPNVQIQVTAGDPATEILRIADQRGADLIVLASHGRGAIGRVAFGSVADRVAHASPIPVMIVRPQDAAAEPAPVVIHRLVVPLDGSELAAQALPVAEALARQLGVPTVLVRAVDLIEALGPIADALVIPPEVVADAQTEAQRSLEAAATSLREKGIEAETQIWTGPAFNVLAEAARPGDLVVLCSHGRSGVMRWLLGSVAEKLVRVGPVPVVVVPVRGRGSTEIDPTTEVGRAQS
ncbi:MAG TPA: universal stress protein [Thermomicrobiales bacterium]|jgi:nucleotide-binding universal stress UspA family protein